MRANPKNSQLIMSIVVQNCINVEKLIMRSFKQKFIQRTEIKRLCMHVNVDSLVKPGLIDVFIKHLFHKNLHHLESRTGQEQIIDQPCSSWTLILLKSKNMAPKNAS